MQNTETVFQHSSLSVLKLNGFTTKQPGNVTENVNVKILVPPQNAVAWFISIMKKTFVLIPEPFVELRNGMDTYEIRTVVERDINHSKDNLCLAGRWIQNEKTLHADLILAGITQLITVALTDKINYHEYIRSLKPLIA